MSKLFSFDCGCSFKVLDDSKVPKIDFSSKVDDLNLSCRRTWQLISEGNTKGCFQLESRLGQMMAKKLKPENIEQLSGLIAILRPGCLESMRDGKSITNHYIDKKNGLESIDLFHPALEPALKTTYGEMIYQEESMQIAHDIAGFDLQEADMLRKAIGKKKPEEMAKIKKKFLDGAKKLNIVTIKEAEEIFGWIEKSQRYSFNKCLDVNTIVETPYGIKTLDDIKIGDKVLGPVLDQDEFIEVLDVINTGEKEVVEIELDNGQTITATLDHQFLCNDDQKHPLWEIIAMGLEIMVYE